MRRTLGLALLMAWLICGCATLYPDTFVTEYGKVQGHDLVIGHFDATVGEGYFVLLSQHGEAWSIDQIAELPMPVPIGGERLYFRTTDKGKTAVTIAFDPDVTVKSERTGLYVCSRKEEPPDPAKYYTPCSSRFTDSMVEATERGIDRDELVEVITKSDALAAGTSRSRPALRWSRASPRSTTSTTGCACRSAKSIMRRGSSSLRRSRWKA